MSFVAEERKKHTIYPPAHEVFSWTRTCDIQDVSFFLLSYSYPASNTRHRPEEGEGI